MALRQALPLTTDGVSLMRRHVVHMALALTVFSSACVSITEDEELVVAAFNVTLDAATSAAILGTPFTFSNGGFFAPEFAGQPFELTLTSATTFTASGGGVTVSGTVSYPPCRFESEAMGTVTFEPCTLTVRSNASTTELKVRFGSTSSQTSTLDVGLLVQENGDGTCSVSISPQPNQIVILELSVPCLRPTGGTGGNSIVGPGD